MSTTTATKSTISIHWNIFVVLDLRLKSSYYFWSSSPSTSRASHAEDETSRIEGTERNGTRSETSGMGVSQERERAGRSTVDMPMIQVRFNDPGVHGVCNWD